MLKKRGREEEEVIEKINNKKQKNDEEDDDFKTFGIDSGIADKLKAKSILALFEVQKKVFKPIYDGENVIAASLTGSGKTLSFVLPIVQKAIDKNRFKHTKPVCLVITPTRELSIQVGREFMDLSSPAHSYKSVLVYGGVPIDDQSRYYINI